MNRFRWLTVLGFLLIGISANAQEIPASLDVSKPWCFNVDITAPGGPLINLMPGPKLYLLNNGDLLTEVTLNKYVTDAVSKGSKAVWFVSANGGIEWSVLKKKPADFAAINLGGGFHQACGEGLCNGALKLSDGTLLATTSPGFENFRESEREKLAAQGYSLFDHQHGNAPGVVSVIRKFMMSRSRDGGKSLETKDIELPFMAEIATYSKAIVLRDGTYIQPAWGLFNKDERWLSSLAIRTNDNGDHWEMSTIAKGKDFDLGEPSITQAPNGDVVAVMRTTAQKELWTATSSDGGKTWSSPRDSGMRGSTPWVVTTKQGLLVAVYSRRDTKLFPTTGMFACVSRDNGQSWDVEHQAMIRDNGTGTVDGYPQAVALPDGSVFAVYGLWLSIPGRTVSGGISASTRLAVGGTRFSPAYQGIPVLSFEQAPAEPK
jgi:hypothetical protein